MKYVLLIAGLFVATQTVPAADQGQAAAPSKETQSAGQAGNFSGKVLETTNAAGYTYVLIGTGTNKVWVAAPQFPVKVGDSVTTAEGMPMTNYHSKTLNRDFDVVYFTSSVRVNGKQPAGSMSQMPKGHSHPPMGPAAHANNSMPQMPKDHPPMGAVSPKAKVDVSGISKAPGGKTVEEIFTSKDKLNGQQVTVRGKVVKFNPAIMNRNWIHLQDGTGGPGSNDLLVTTVAGAKVGDTVLVSGTVSTNKDFGAGYKYGVMLENARVTVE